MSHQLVRQGPRYTADAEREDDVLDRRTVPRFDDGGDALLHLERIEIAVEGPPEDVFGSLFGVARPARGVDDGDVVLVDDLAVREQERRRHAEIAAAWVLRDRRHVGPQV